MQVTSLTSREEHAPDDHDHHTHDHEHIPVRLWQMVIGVIFIANSFLVGWIFDKGSTVAGLSAMAGAIILGWPIVTTAIRDIRRGILSINELVAIAVLAAFAAGAFRSGESPVGGYQTTGIIAFFMLLGELIETRTAAGARASIESLIKLTPTRARRLLAGGKEEEVPAQDLAVGDVIRIRPGDNVAADGLIVNGQGSFNQANITGESLPVDKKPGDEVFAGTQNLTGVLEVRVTRAGQDTTLGRVRELILAAEKTKLPVMRVVDQYMGFYTPLVLVIGALVWAFTQDLSRVIAVFIVSCPCAFILATPTAMVAALSAAARLGILIKNVGDIELAARINAFIFDKTGTLTTGKLVVSRLAPLGETKPAELLRLAASAEKYSNHPTAKALAQLAEEAGVPLVEPKDFAESAGRGIKARVDGAEIIIGREQWLKDNGVKEGFGKSVDLNETEGYSLIFVARNGQCVGWVGLQDQTRAEARESLAGLKDTGVRRIAMVTGDRQPVPVAHRDAAHARVLQSGKRFARFGAGLVLQAHPTDALAVARDKNQAVAFGLVQVRGFLESFFHAVVLQPLLPPDDDFRAIDARLDAASGGFHEVLRFCQWHPGFLGQLRERLGRGVVAVFLGRGRQPEQFCRLRFAQRRETADREFARRQRSGLVEDEGVDARGQLDVADVLDQNAQTRRR